MTRVSLEGRSRAARLVVLVCALLLPVTLSAQERLFSVFKGRLTELDATRGRLGRPVASIDFPPSSADLVPVAGGRLLAFTRSLSVAGAPRYQLYLADLRTGAITEALVASFAGEIVASDPRVPRLFVDDGDRLAVVDLSVMTTSYFAVDVTPRSPTAIAYSPTGPLFLQANGPVIAVLDLATGTTRAITAASAVSGMVVDPAGSRVYVTGSGSPDSSGIFAYDLANGALLASNTPLYVGDSSQGTLRLDPTRNRVIVAQGPVVTPKLVTVLNAGTLAVEATVPLSALAGFTPPPSVTETELYPTEAAQFEYSARRDGLYLAATQSLIGFPVDTASADLDTIPPGCFQTTLSRLDAASGATIERSDLTTLTRTVDQGFATCGTSLIVVRTPEAPTASAIVEGGMVGISWTDPGNLTHYELEAGTAPGLRDIAVFQVHATRLVVPGVPPGRYHVRVRAINDVGRSLPSNELTIVVQ